MRLKKKVLLTFVASGVAWWMSLPLPLLQHSLSGSCCTYRNTWGRNVIPGTVTVGCCLGSFTLVKGL
jgi:hypothetical protein